MSGRLNNDEAARYLGLSPHTLRTYRRTGGGPVYEKGPTRRHRAYYRREDLEAWLAANRRRRRATCEDGGGVSSGA